jgi:hypothetical protein
LAAITAKRRNRQWDSRLGMRQNASGTIILLALCAAMLSQAATTGNPHTQGYPPLAVAYITIQNDKLSELRNTLKKFAQAERLEFAEGSFEKKGSAVQTFYLKEHDDAPVFAISNFMEANRYRAIAYAGADESQWQPRWLKLLSVLREKLGAGSISDD